MELTPPEAVCTYNAYFITKAIVSTGRIISLAGVPRLTIPAIGIGRKLCCFGAEFVCTQPFYVSIAVAATKIENLRLIYLGF